jgi:integrase
MASIRKRGKDSYRVQVFLRNEKRADGTVRKVFHGETVRGSLRDAEARGKALDAKYSQGNLRATASTDTFEALLDRWVADFGYRWSPDTLRTNQQVIETDLKPGLGSIKLGRLTAQDLDRFYQGFRDRGNKASTIRRKHALIRRALAQAVKWGLVDTNVADLASPEPVGRTPVEAPSTVDVEAFTLACDRTGQAWLGAFLRLEGFTGMRRGELVALRWSDVTLDGDDWETATGGKVAVSRSLYTKAGGGWGEKAPKTKAGTRVVPLLNGAFDILRWHREDMVRRIEKPDQYVAPLTQLLRTVPADGFIFTPDVFGWARPYMPNTVTRAAARVAEDSGIKIHPHQMRHWCATELLAHNVPASIVAGILGHADASITLRVYDSPASDERMADALALLSQSTTDALPTAAAR